MQRGTDERGYRQELLFREIRQTLRGLSHGAAGKPVETPLDLHLKVGNAAENLLRIYFLYDTEKQLVVVGSLPKHLTAVQVQ